MDIAQYPKRLIEVDLPIKRISAHARREKSIRHGHISTLHIWWARRPLAACRAVICAALWPDPADPLCPPAFRVATVDAVTGFARAVAEHTAVANLVGEDFGRWTALHNAALEGTRLNPDDGNDMESLRGLLLDFIAAFSAWEASVEPHFLETARALTQAAHEALGGTPGTRPLVVDPFAGGGSIPLEALRVGADAFASDLNPVAVLLNKVVLEYIPRYGNAEFRFTDEEGQEVVLQGLAEAVRYWGDWIKRKAEAELAEFYPPDEDGATPIAYLWARTITCEGPGCGAEVPLMRSLWLAKKAGRSRALRLIPRPEQKRVDFDIVENHRAREVGEGTVKRGSATCRCCGYTTPVASVRRQLKARRGGAEDARLFCVVTTRPGEKGRFYRLPTERDLEAVRKAAEELERRKAAHTGELSLVPDEPLDIRAIRLNWCMLYGITHWGDLFTPRQALALTTLAQLVGQIPTKGGVGTWSAVQALVAIAVNREADASSSLCRWHVTGEKHTGTFGRQAIPLVWDFSEVSPLSESTGGFPGAVDWVRKVCEANIAVAKAPAQVARVSATSHPLLADTVDLVATDPPYYDAVPYAYLSDYFYVWLRRSLSPQQSEVLSECLVPKDEEIVVDRPHELSNSHKDIMFYERELTRAFAESRRILRHDGIGTIVFASKTTASWEAIVRALLEAGWIVTGSWPVDTEMAARVSAQGQARLASSVHLVCRPRQNPDGSLREEVGDWRDVLQELPGRIHAWLPRLAQEGVVGADAIFACLGPALEVFSRYSSVERASGEEVTLREYLEHVWAAVAREALGMIFEGADATGFEQDARLTAMWLWTLSAGANDNGAGADSAEEGEDELPRNGAGGGGYVLEYDAARKIAQGLGVHLEQLTSLVQVKGETARLLPVADRRRHLFAGEGREKASSSRGRRRRGQLSLMEDETEHEDGGPEWGELQAASGRTVLDRVHQSMILFAAGRGAALTRFLVEEGHGRDGQFWKLADALCRLYPAGSQERRWVEGVLARKKGLGL